MHPSDLLERVTEHEYVHRRRFGQRFAATLIETSIVLIIATAAMAAGAKIYGDHLSNRTNQIAAQEMNKVADAYGRYLKDHYGQILQEAHDAGGRVHIPIQTLVDGGYMYESFENRNPYGQEYNLIARYVPSTNPGSEDRLETVVYTSGGEAITPGQANSIAQLVGAGGGFTMPEGDTSEVKSTFGGFTLDMQTSYGVDPGPGKLVSAMFFNDEGSLVSDFLYRNAVPGRPDLNTMGTSINMDGNNINNVDALSAQRATISGKLFATDAEMSGQVSAGGAAVGANTLTSHGTTLLQGEVGIGGGAIAGQALNVAGNVRFAGNTITTGNATVGSLSSNGTITAQGSITTTGNASIAGNASVGSLASSGAINAAGNISTGGNVTAGTIYTGGWFRSTGASGWYSETYGGGWYMQDTTWIRAYGNKSIYTPGTIQAGTLTVDGNASIGGNLTATGGVRSLKAGAPGSACSGGEIGQYGSDTMVCASGVWRVAGTGRLHEMQSCAAGPVIGASFPVNGPAAASGTIWGDACMYTRGVNLCIGGAWVQLEPGRDCGGGGN